MRFTITAHDPKKGTSKAHNVKVNLDGEHVYVVRRHLNHLYFVDVKLDKDGKLLAIDMPLKSYDF